MKYCKNIDQITDSGVYIAIKSYSSKQLHLGVLYKDDDECSVIHLNGHYSLRSSDHVDSYNFVNISQFNELDHIHMMSHLLATYRLNCEIGIPYGPCGGGVISESGEFLGEIGDGLTCSSFVLQMFESQSYILIDKSTWPNRDSDIQWQEELLQDLNYKFNREQTDITHFAEQRKKLGALRFTPNEVAASTTFENYQNCFDDIEPISLEILTELTS